MHIAIPCASKSSSEPPQQHLIVPQQAIAVQLPQEVQGVLQRRLQLFQAQGLQEALLAGLKRTRNRSTPWENRSKRSKIQAASRFCATQELSSGPRSSKIAQRFERRSTPHTSGDRFRVL